VIRDQHVLTLESVVNEIRKMEEADFSEVGHALIKASLSGARGNSGVILSQILKGFGRVYNPQMAGGSPYQISS